MKQRAPIYRVVTRGYDNFAALAVDRLCFMDVAISAG
jgi:hypothetical protein